MEALTLGLLLLVAVLASSLIDQIIPRVSLPLIQIVIGLLIAVVAGGEVEVTLDPELFLFDEPFGALDEITREHLNDELLRLFVATRFAGLFITHSVSEAVYLSTKVVVMSGRPGHIVDTFEVPFDMPRDPEVRYTGAFAELVGQVSHALREGHR